MRSITSCSLLVLTFMPAFTQALENESNDDAPPAQDAQKQIDELIAQQNKLADQYNAILREIRKNEQLVALDKAIAAGRAKLAAAEADNSELTAARDAEQQVREEVKKAVQQKLKEDSDGAKLLARVDEMQAKRAEQQWQAALAQFQLDSPLSPVNRALADDEELAAVKARLDAATIEERTEAKAEYDALRAAKLAELDEGQRLLAVIEDSTDAAERLSESIVAVEQRLIPIRKEIEQIESKRIAAAREKIAAALNSDAIVTLRKQLNEQITQYNTRIKELTADSAEATRLKAEYDAVRAKVAELRAAQQ